MNIKLKSLATLALGVSIGIGGASAFAKGHDQGVADGTRFDPSIFRGGVTAGVNTPGIGSFEGKFDGGLCAEEYGFCGVVGDPGQTYGRDIVSEQRARGIRRITPIVQPGLNKPPRDE